VGPSNRPERGGATVAEATVLTFGVGVEDAIIPPPDEDGVVREHAARTERTSGPNERRMIASYSW
jgi:hypothetical protein